VGFGLMVLVEQVFGPQRRLYEGFQYQISLKTHLNFD
jgi:hypothetical protein